MKSERILFRAIMSLMMHEDHIEIYTFSEEGFTIQKSVTSYKEYIFDKNIIL